MICNPLVLKEAGPPDSVKGLEFGDESGTVPDEYSVKSHHPFAWANAAGGGTFPGTDECDLDRENEPDPELDPDPDLETDRELDLVLEEDPGEGVELEDDPGEGVELEDILFKTSWF